MREKSRQDSLLKGRVIIAHLTKYIVELNNKKYSLEVSGRFKYMALDKSDYPVVGDYVLFMPTYDNEGIIETVVERRNTIKRLAVSDIHNGQIIAANIDLVFVCMSLNNDFNITKLQKLLSLTYSDDYQTIILLTKSDLCDNPTDYINEVKIINGEEVITVSVFNDSDINEIEKIIGKRSCVFIGSSGVGKSTIINSLIGEEHFATKGIRETDAQGRHTTVHRELIHLKNGGVVIDTPGIRTIDSYYIADMESHFDDITQLANDCRFRDCTHTNEVGCQVKEAILSGDLPIERFDQYQHAERLNRFVIRREKQKQRIQEKRQHKRK